MMMTMNCQVGIFPGDALPFPSPKQQHQSFKDSKSRYRSDNMNLDFSSAASTFTCCFVCSSMYLVSKSIASYSFDNFSLLFFMSIY